MIAIVIKKENGEKERFSVLDVRFQVFSGRFESGVLLFSEIEEIFDFLSVGGFVVFVEYVQVQLGQKRFVESEGFRFRLSGGLVFVDIGQFFRNQRGGVVGEFQQVWFFGVQVIQRVCGCLVWCGFQMCFCMVCDGGRGIGVGVGQGFGLFKQFKICGVYGVDFFFRGRRVGLVWV